MNDLPRRLALDGPPATLARSESASLIERWYVLIMMCLVYTISIADRYVVSTVLDPIRLDLHLTDFQIALLTAWPLAIFYVLLGFPLSWLVDRKNRRTIIAVCMVAWSVMTALTGLSRNVWQFFVTRVGVGIGEAGGTPGANSLLSDYFPASRRPMALTIFSLGAPFGAWVGATLAGFIADLYGWRAVFYALGIPGVLAGLAVWLTIREPQRGCLDSEDDGEPAPSFWTTMRFWWQQRSAVHLMVASALCALWGWGLMYWTPTFLQRTYHMTPGQAGELTGNIHLWGGAAATVVTGWLMGLKVMADARRIVWLLGIGIGIATLASGVVYYTHDLFLTKVMLWIFIPSIYFYIGPCFGLLNNLALCKMRAMFCATTLFLANVGNLVIAPPLLGNLSDLFQGLLKINNTASLRLAMLCLVPTGLWATVHYFISAKDLEKDQQRAKSFPY